MKHIDVVVRCRNEMPHTTRTLEALANQRGVVARVLFIDCASTDGSREAAVEAGVSIVDFPPERYRPGLVLNLAMRDTWSDVVAFVNADAVPLDRDALARLIAPFADVSGLAATYASQPARPDAAPWTQVDHAHAFGAEVPRLQRGHFFSMAASAIRRDVWQATPFDEALRYSEDVDWTHRVQQQGWKVRYVADARFEHSHDYTLKQQFKRRRGEGDAETRIRGLGAPSLWNDLVRPFGGAVLRDARALQLGLEGVAMRASQALGFYAGRRAGVAQ